jgi:hypothetical protein
MPCGCGETRSEGPPLTSGDYEAAGGRYQVVTADEVRGFESYREAVAYRNDTGGHLTAT